MKTGPQLVINHMIFFDMIGDPAFYSKVPAFFFMRDQGLAIHKKITDAVLEKAGCRGCTNMRQQVWPIFQVFAQQAFLLGQENPEALKPLGDYIAGKKGYRPTEILLYFRYQGITHKLVI